jgi:sirohydrochlorin cobaltochelatase
MPDAIEKALAAVLSESNAIGEILIRRRDAGGFALCHRDDERSDGLKVFSQPEDSIQIARFDDVGNYRALKTAPNLRHGWRLDVVDLGGLRRALDYFYPGRLAALAAWTENKLTATSLRETLNRQSGMYRVAAKISDDQIDDVVGNSCRSDGGCLRTILWKRDRSGAVPSSKLSPEKFDATHDQTGRGERAIPLLCQEICSIVLNECRKAVKGEIDE